MALPAHTSRRVWRRTETTVRHETRPGSRCRPSGRGDAGGYGSVLPAPGRASLALIDQRGILINIDLFAADRATDLLGAFDSLFAHHDFAGDPGLLLEVDRLRR